MSEKKGTSKRRDVAALLGKLATASRLLTEVAQEALELAAEDPPPVDDDALVGAKALAQELSVSDETIARLAKTKRIPFLEVGGRRRFSVRAVRAALAEPQPKPAPADVLLLSRAGRTGGSR